MRVKVKRRKKGLIRSNIHQTLPQRIKWLRMNQKPYMTQTQLSELSRVSQDMISRLENCNTSALNMRISTLKKIAQALGCQIYVNLKVRPSQSEAECLPLDHDLPPLPKQKRRTTDRHRALVAKYGNSPWKEPPQPKRSSRSKATSGKRGSDLEDQSIVHGAAWDTE